MKKPTSSSSFTLTPAVPLRMFFQRQRALAARFLGSQKHSHTKERRGKTKAQLVSGFTLIETLVAIALLTVAIIAPMALTVQSLKSAFYARDQVTAFYLAQEAIESVRSIRDSQILRIAKSSDASSIDLFGSIPKITPFTIDVTRSDAIQTCSGTCQPLKTDGTLYGYQSGWTKTNFTRTVIACYVQPDSGACNSTRSDEMRVSVTISWQTQGIKTRTFTIVSDMYRWVKDGSGV